MIFLETKEILAHSISEGLQGLRQAEEEVPPSIESFEPRHDYNVVVRPTKTQISLGIRPVWSESSLSAWRNLGSLATHWAQAKTLIRLGGCPGDQTGWMPRLIWVFAGRTLTLLVLSCRGSIFISSLATTSFVFLFPACTVLTPPTFGCLFCFLIWRHSPLVRRTSKNKKSLTKRMGDPD